jgi:hypothetical protein
MTTIEHVRTQSYWQQGCEDGKAGRGPKRPNPNTGMFGDYTDRMQNQGYMNGYRFGQTRRCSPVVRYEPVTNEGSEP